MYIEGINREFSSESDEGTPPPSEASHEAHETSAESSEASLDDLAALGMQVRTR